MLLGPASAAPARAQDDPNPFGVMFPGSNPDFVSLASDIGANYVRRLVVVSTWGGRCGGCNAYRSAGVEVVLTVRNNGAHKVPTTPPTSLDLYRMRVEDIVDSVRPVLLVVENEETSRAYYRGTAADYEAQLRVACEVAHSRGIPCTNGGIQNPLAIRMTYVNFLDNGRRDRADSYARRTSLSDEEYERLTDRDRRQKVRDSAARGFKFVDRYRAAGADFINFHWYRADAKAFGQTVSFFQKRTGLGAISNEIGQYTNSPDQIRGIMDRVLRKHMQYAIWFSIDLYVDAQDRETRALQRKDYSLRRHGRAYRDFITTNF